MSNTKKKTGLGKSAFFNRSQENGADEQARTTPQDVQTQEPKKPKKVRTTVTLYPETLASMELLKVEARKGGEKATFSDVLAEAITELMQKKGLAID